jgi:hypothetical protein
LVISSVASETGRVSPAMNSPRCSGAAVVVLISGSHELRSALLAEGGESLASVRGAEQALDQLSLQLKPVGQRLLHVALGATSVTAVASPLAPDVQPADGRIDGNVYRVELQAEPTGTVTLGAGGGPALIYLRAVSLKPADPVLEFRPTPGAPWRALHTSRGGRDVFVGAFAAAGDYALVHQKRAQPAPRPKSQGTLLWLLGGFAVVVLALVALTRWSARRTAGQLSVGEESPSSER